MEFLNVSLRVMQPELPSRSEGRENWAVWNKEMQNKKCLDRWLSLLLMVRFKIAFEALFGAPKLALTVLCA